MERIGTLELTNLMETYTAYALTSKAQGHDDIARKHATRAMSYVAELNRRNAA